MAAAREEDGGVSGSGDGDGGGGDGDDGVQRPPPPAIYSDTLYYRYMGANLPLAPEWLSVDTIPRRHHASLSKRQFIDEFEAANLPVVLSRACAHWPAVKHARWSRESLTSLTSSRGDTAGSGSSSPRSFNLMAPLLNNQLKAP